AEATLVDAARRSDIYARSLFATSPSVWTSLIRDDPDGAAARLAEGRKDWPDEPFLLVHYLEMTSGAAIDLYRGDPAAAKKRLDDGLARLRTSVLSKMPWVMAEYRRYYACAATRVGDVAAARKWLGPLSALDAPLVHGYLAAYDGIFALRAGRADEGERRLVEGIHSFDDAGTPQLSQAAKFQLGRAVGGVEGARMSDEALAWMRAAGVARPEPMIDLLLPPV
ncbi:MAG TPA: hypothetical protein VGL86_09765, partial [Polyangia bacterium]